MEVLLKSKKDISIVDAVKINTDKVTINQVTDNYTSVIALISFGDGITGKTKSIILWEDAAYEAIGQWTDTDVTNRLKEIL